MPKPRENQFWLTKDENDWKELREKFEILQKNYLLSIEQSIKSKFANAEWINPGSIFITIDNTISELECLKKEQVEPLGKKIIKNLESKKISSFKNFIIRFFTFGKINKNRGKGNIKF